MSAEQRAELWSRAVPVLAMGAGLMVAVGLAAGPAEWGDGGGAHVHADGQVHRHGPASGAMEGHEASEGLVLARSEGETVSPGGPCSSAMPVRRYELAAVAVEITLNRYLDHDPDGRMFVLEADLEDVRREEAANARAREDGTEPAVSMGLQGDAIQPLTLRVLPGECLQVRLRNDLPADEPASFHVHGSQLVVADTGRPALATEPSSIARAGKTVVYEWAVPPGEPEATHYVHSHGDTRVQTAHGLFGAVVVEPAGSTWVDALDGTPDTVSWSAVVTTPKGDSFREFVAYYHEVGTEGDRLPLGSDGAPLPQVDPITSSYRPSSRALNYRSEPFMHRLQEQVDRDQPPDESVAYSSYSFGDPATPVMRAYLGDAVKQRVVHAGSEVFHVHHVHGGSIRWPRQPGLDPPPTITDLDKDPPLTPARSERTDSQSVGPSESFDVEPECGAGGCQQSAGDILFHCHVAQHYISGMWGIWRVYNTLQDGAASTDQLPPLPALADRADEMPPAVTSTELPDDLAGGIEDQLPPAGAAVAGDASVWDWTEQDGLYLGEPLDTTTWPGYTPVARGRPPLLFDPRDGRLAYPHLQPHLGRRPPFAPGHGPAPYLDPGGGDAQVPRPGENGDRSVCPEGTRVRDLDITAVDVPIPLNAEENLLDPHGMLFVRREERDQLEDDLASRQPLVLRANATRDCVDVTLTSEVADDADNGWLSKVNAHIHFVQFDVQASDGVDAGFNYEQSVRPWTVEAETVTADVARGTTRIEVERNDRFRPGALVMVGVDTADRSEVRTIAGVEPGALVLAEPLEHDHQVGERVTTEFVRYRWYPDVQFGTAFFHDHVNAIFSGRHGLWGALVAEPPDATWHDPDTGEELLSGAIADVHTTGTVSADTSGSFRELVAFLQDDNPIASEGRSSGSSLGLRIEPLDPRMADDPATAFDSTVHGDPETPILRARPGDPLVVRTLVSATNDVHTIHLAGHAWRFERWSDTSPPVAAAHLGISERLDLVVPSAGGPARLPGDYLLRNGRATSLHEGSWGLVRVHEPTDPDAPRPLPGVQEQPSGSKVCPGDAPVRSMDVTAVETALPMLGGDLGVVFVPTDQAEAVQSGQASIEPLVVRATVGDCLELTVHNATARPLSIEPDLMVFDPDERAVGHNGGGPIPSGEQRTSRFHAHPDFGEATALLLDGGDPLAGPSRGAYGAVAVAERGAEFRDPTSGDDVTTGWRVDVVPPDGPAYRDAVLFLHEEDESIGTHLMPYRNDVEGTVGLNYEAAPLADRLLVDADPARVFRSDVHGDPSTPIVEAHAGDPVRLRVAVPVAEQGQVFTVEGHRWPLEPRLGSMLVASLQVGGLEAPTVNLEDGAGGSLRLAGDYLLGDHREPHREAGLWGLLRVRSDCTDDRLLRLPTNQTCGEPGRGSTVMLLPWSVLASGLLGVAVWLVRRRWWSAASRTSPQEGVV